MATDTKTNYKNMAIVVFSLTSGDGNPPKSLLLNFLIYLFGINSP